MSNNKHKSQINRDNSIVDFDQDDFEKDQEEAALKEIGEVDETSALENYLTKQFRRKVSQVGLSKYF